MPTPKSAADARAVLIFDGECGFCSRWVLWLIDRDREGRFAVAPSSSQAARTLLNRHGFGDGPLGTVVLIDDGRAWTRSEAVLRALSALGGAYRLARIARIVPRPLRDAVYGLVARYRRRLAGATCPSWNPIQRSRRLDETDG
ncbi:MAG: DCC1-like thiol-disulfide oxidoreductase family protein [Fimbriimonadaceae bacterium]